MDDTAFETRATTDFSMVTRGSASRIFLDQEPYCRASVACSSVAGSLYSQRYCLVSLRHASHSIALTRLKIMTTVMHQPLESPSFGRSSLHAVTLGPKKTDPKAVGVFSVSEAQARWRAARHHYDNAARWLAPLNCFPCTERAYQWDGVVLHTATLSSELLYLLSWVSSSLESPSTMSLMPVSPSETSGCQSPSLVCVYWYRRSSGA